MGVILNKEIVETKKFEFEEYCDDEKFEEYVLDFIDKKYDFSERDIWNLIDSFEYDEVVGDNQRWTRTVSKILKVKERFFSVKIEEGLTECQESFISDKKLKEVKPVEKINVVTLWEEGWEEA